MWAAGGGHTFASQTVLPQPFVYWVQGFGLQGQNGRGRLLSFGVGTVTHARGVGMAKEHQSLDPGPPAPSGAGAQVAEKPQGLRVSPWVGRGPPVHSPRGPALGLG